MSLVFILLLVISFLRTATVSDVAVEAQMPVVSQESAVDGERLISTLPGAQTLGVASEISIRLYVNGGVQEASGDIPPGAIVMADGNPPVLLAGDHDGCMAGLPGSPLQRSDDGGQTWTAEADARPLRPLAIWPDGLALASDCAGLQVSTDAGLSWTMIDGIPAGFDVTSFAAVAGDASERVVLVGLTSEGGTSTLHSIDLSDPAKPVVSEGLRQYYAIGGIAGAGDTFIQVGMDGPWISTDAGARWERQADGLEGLVLERDPLEFGLPEDFDPNSAGMDAVVVSEDTIIAATTSGVFQRQIDGTTWTQVPGTSGNVAALAVSADGATLIYLADGMAHEVSLSAN